MIVTNVLKISLKKNSKIKDAILSLNKSGNQIVLIIDNQKKLIGTITDGDIRRGILKGYRLSDSILKIMNHSPKVIKNKIPSTESIKFMNKKNINHLPVVNNLFQLKGIYFVNKSTKINKKKNIFFILAGGRGTRLKPFTNNCPKPLLKVRGKPMLKHIIDKAKKQGFSNFHISINYLGKMIKDFFNSGKSLGVKINYINEKKKLGTAGSLSLIKKKISGPIIVTNGDVITDINYADMLKFHEKKKSDFTLAVFPYQNKNPYGIVETLNYDVIRVKEKPITQNNINAGVYILDQKVLKLIKKNQKLDMTSLIKKIKNENYKILAYALHENWNDIGRIDDFKKIRY